MNPKKGLSLALNQPHNCDNLLDLCDERENGVSYDVDILPPVTKIV
jgi:hypothetical protein